MNKNGNLKELDDKSINLFNERGVKLCSAFPNYKTQSLASCLLLFVLNV